MSAGGGSATARVPPRLSGHGFRRPGEVATLRQSLTRAYRSHWHEFHEIVLVTAGQGRHRIDGVSYPIAEGDMLVIPPSSLHAVAPDPGVRLDLIDVTVDAHSLPPEVPSLLVSLTTTTRPARATDRLARLFDDLARETESPRPHRQLVSHALVSQLVVALQRDWMTSSPDRPSPAWLPRLLDHIERHYTHPLSTADLAAVAHLSPPHLRQLFRRETGSTLTEHLQHVRLRAARALLATTDMPISQVRQASGFGDASHFARVFRAAFACSPTAYRNTIR